MIVIEDSLDGRHAWGTVVACTSDGLHWVNLFIKASEEGVPGVPRVRAEDTQLGTRLWVDLGLVREDTKLAELESKLKAAQDEVTRIMDELVRLRKMVNVVSNV